MPKRKLSRKEMYLTAFHDDAWSDSDSVDEYGREINQVNGVYLLPPL